VQNCDRETRGELQTASGFNNSDLIDDCTLFIRLG
jgi:hypothetical protein